ncbi:MAG: DUF2157 domain-containing protein [Sphingobacteriaceae bacterium]|nr:MAG: DUF2157 domain-containing protein [Sphingobacteriaceae bacterium]
MDYNLFKKLHQEGLISEESFEQISREEQYPLVSVHWDINTLLGTGVIALSTGLGILIYKNINTIGHQIILTLIAGISIVCFMYCARKKSPFSWFKVTSPDRVFDYVLLLGTLTMLTFTAYLQYQYNVFGTSYGLATFLPMTALFFIAYYFDHLGVLNLAIVNLAVWLGVSVTPKQLLIASNYNSETIIYTYLFLGLFLLLIAFLTTRYRLKPHFKFSYQHYGVHTSFIAQISAYFYNNQKGFAFLWLFGVMLLAFLLYKDALKHKSFYFLLLALVYSYIAVSCLTELLFSINGNANGTFVLMIIYVPFSIGVFIYLLKQLSHKIKVA